MAVFRKPHGVLFAEKLNGRWYITSITVDEGYRGHGIGSALMTEAMDKLGRPVLLYASGEFGSDPKRLRKFYRRFGFRGVRQMKGDWFPYKYNMICDD